MGSAAAGRGRLVELGHQRPHLGHARGVGRAQHQRVAARLGQQRGFERGVGLALRTCACARAACAAARVDQPRHQRRQVGGNGVLQRNHFHVAGIGHIHGRNDLAQALQVVGVVRDHQRVGAGVDVDGVVRADERAQHRHQVARAFVVELEDLRDDLPTRRAAAARLGHADAAALQFGIGLGHHFVKARSLHHRVTLQAQRRQKLLEGGGGRHGALGHQIELAFDARVNHHVAPGDGGHGAGHGLDVGVGKVQRHGLARAHAGGAGVDGGLCMNMAASAYQ